MTNSKSQVGRDGLLAAILSDEGFWPTEPDSLDDTGLPVSLIESLLCKRLLLVGMSTGRNLAENVALPFRILEDLLQSLRERQIIVHKASAPFNDYTYALTQAGRDRASTYMESCAYVGPAPVPLSNYVLSAEAQTIRAEQPRRDDLRAAFRDISIDENLFESLGPAINSGAGLFLYGEPGNGKSTLAQRITMCFGQQVWIPQTVVEDGQLIKIFDAAFHEAEDTQELSFIRDASYDSRWIKIRRPTVVVGGELTMDSLEIRHDPHSNVSEAPLQMKSNCGCLLVDDFGRQRIDPIELLNRWIVPLESRVDYLTLSTGKKIQVPFEQLIIFSTNLEPSDLVDEAFLRRIPYKIEISDPGLEEFHQLFEIYAEKFDCEYRQDVVDYLLKTHYEGGQRARRRCHPRDLLCQIRNYCAYNDIPMEMRDEYFDRVVRSYFTDVLGPPSPQSPPSPAARPSESKQPGPSLVCGPDNTLPTVDDELKQVVPPGPPTRTVRQPPSMPQQPPSTPQQPPSTPQQPPSTPRQPPSTPRQPPSMPQVPTPAASPPSCPAHTQPLPFKAPSAQSEQVGQP